jgi:uncharacterized membrane protein
MNWFHFLHALHVLAAGIWVGGLVFTTFVVSPAFKRMEWSPADRIAVRSAVGRQYSRIAGLNLAVLFVAALADWLPAGLGAMALAELGLILLILVLSGMHGRVYAPRLAQAARDDRPVDSLRLQRVSVGVSMLNLILSLSVAVLSSLRTP